MHTKGKWEWSEINQLLSGNDCILILIYDAECDFWRIHISEDNKRLIAAAPEMLELLEDCRESFEILIEGFPRYTLIERKLEEIKSLLSKIKGCQE
jgi:hypothetical protein